MARQSTNLTSLPQKKITTGLKRLQEAGLTPNRWLKMLDAQSSELQHIVAAFPGAPEPIRQATGIVYDAAAMSRILGITCKCSDPVPEAVDGEVVIYYGGWDLPTLRKSAAGQKRMVQDKNWYDDKGWKAEPGYYRVLLRVPDSNRRNWNEQVNHLKTIDEAWQPTPVTIAATALLVHLAETGNDLLRNDWCRCAEPLPDRLRVGLTVSYNRVRVCHFWDNYSLDDLWLSAARRMHLPFESPAPA